MPSIRAGCSCVAQVGSFQIVEMFSTKKAKIGYTVAKRL